MIHHWYAGYETPHMNLDDQGELVTDDLPIRLPPGAGLPDVQGRQAYPDSVAHLPSGQSTPTTCAASLDPELLDGFAVVLGVPVEVLASLTGVHHMPVSRRNRQALVETAALLWDVRHLTVEQVRQVSHSAD